MKRKDFITLLAIRKKNKIKKKRVAPVWHYPTNAEKKYHKELNNLIYQTKILIKEFLYPELPGLIDEVNRNTPQDRLDDFVDRLRGIIIHIGKTLKPHVENTVREASIIGREIAIFNKKQSENLNRSIFGIDIFVNEPWLTDQLHLFSIQNSQLIVSLPEQELDRVAGIVERGLQQGLSHKQLIPEIQKTFGISQRRAKLIARDQTSKLNSSLTRLRQQEVGVEEYIWQTSLDERVRPTHKANEGKKFRWDKPSPITGHPGHDVNCRCVARPVLQNLLDIGED